MNTEEGHDYDRLPSLKKSVWITIMMLFNK
jgi:hypothetical protein